MSADGAYPAASGFSVVAFENGARLSHYDAPTYAAFLAHNPAMPYSDNNFYQFDQGETWALEDVGTDSAVVISQTVNFAIPFVYGTTFTVGFYGQASGRRGFAYGNDTGLNSSGADFAHTITWGGKGYVVAADGSGPHVTDFTINSTSGFDYSHPYVDPIPEPSTWAVMLLGFGLAGAVLRRRRAPDAERCRRRGLAGQAKAAPAHPMSSSLGFRVLARGVRWVRVAHRLRRVRTTWSHRAAAPRTKVQTTRSRRANAASAVKATTSR